MLAGMTTNTDFQKLNIICLANQQWDYPLKTNKWHVMSRLAKLGHNVLFVDPPINTGFLLVRQTLDGRWSLKRLITRVYERENVCVYSPLDPLPFHDFMSKQHVGAIKRLARKNLDPSRKTILWVYHVEALGLQNYLEGINHDLLIYDCVDNYEGFPRYDTPKKKEWLKNQEKYLTEKARLVFATAPGLVEKLQRYNKNVFFTPNAGDYKKFINVRSLTAKIPEDLARIPRPRIGFTGAVDEYKFDAQLVKKLAEDYPNYSFVIIGPLALKDKKASAEGLGLSGLKNIYFMGARPYEEIRNYYAGFDVYIIPYQLNDYTVGGCFPVKFHDSLAAGLPVVVTDLPAYTPFEDVCYVSKDYEQFSQNLKKALAEDSPVKVTARQAVAKENDWDGKVAKMLEFIYQAL